MKWGDQYPGEHDLSSLRLHRHRSASRSTPKRGSGTTRHIGGERCPVVDTWWQTETGAIMISPLPGATTLKPGSATFPLPGHRSRHRRRRGRAGRRPGRRVPRARPARGRRCCAASGATRERYRDTYWAAFDGKYFAGDGAKRDDDGYFWLLGRVDDIMLVSGHNISHHRGRVRARRPPRGRRGRGRRQGRRDHRTGHRRVRDPARRPRTERRARRRAARPRRRQLIGPIAKPKTILFTEELPKTRSGKIMRRLLRNVAEDQALGDTTTLADPTVVDGIKSRYLATDTGRGVTAGRVRYLPEHWTLARPTSVDAGPRPSSSTSTACCRTRPAVSTTSRRRAATGDRSSTRAARTR